MTRKPAYPKDPSFKPAISEILLTISVRDAPELVETLAKVLAPDLRTTKGVRQHPQEEDDLYTLSLSSKSLSEARAAGNSLFELISTVKSVSEQVRR